MSSYQFALKEIPEISFGYDSEVIVRRFIKSLNCAKHHAHPYDYWVLDQALPDVVMGGIANLPFSVQKNRDYSYGTRESNNNFRVYFTPENQRRSEVCRAVAAAFRSPRITALIETVTGRDMPDGRLRIEYCQDTDGFWLEPHVDIGAKLFSMIIYLSDDPALWDAGTDIYDASPAHNLVATTPYQKGTATFFMPGEDTWHGFSQRPIRGVRKSLIVNYVTPDWRDKWELA